MSGLDAHCQVSVFEEALPLFADARDGLGGRTVSRVWLVLSLRAGCLKLGGGQQGVDRLVAGGPIQCQAVRRTCPESDGEQSGEVYAADYRLSDREFESEQNVKERKSLHDLRCKRTWNRFGRLDRRGP